MHIDTLSVLLEEQGNEAGCKRYTSRLLDWHFGRS